MRLLQIEVNTSVDVGALLDRIPFSPLQWMVVLLAAASIIFDGLGVQLMGYALPRMASQMGLPATAFAPAVTAGLIGMVLGSAYAGVFADRWGRRWALIVSVLVFGAATVCVGLSGSIGAVVVFRFLAGVGIGGALPTTTTFVAEFTPARLRTVIVTCTIVCVPLGGMFGGLIAQSVLPSYGWPALFIVGGAIPIALSLLLLMLLEETPRFLSRQTGRREELERLLAKMRSPVAPGSHFVDSADRSGAARLTDILAGDLKRETVSLWIAFLSSLFAIYMVFSWLPALLVRTGFTAAQASYGLAIYNAAGVAGAVTCSLVVARFGSRWTVPLCCAGAALLALAANQPAVARSFPILVTVIAVHSFFANAVQSSLYTLAAFVYPTSIRARGTSSAVALGRFGTVLAGAAGAFALGAAGSRFFLLLAAGMAMACAALCTMRRHIPGAPALPASGRG